MPTLYRLAEIGAGGPGFLLPVFRKHKFSNVEMIQHVNEHDRVVEFEDFEIDKFSNDLPPFDVNVEVGDPAIWAFRDHLGQCHVGRATDIRLLSIDLLDSSEFLKFPMAAIDLAAFCDVESKFVQSAYLFLSEISPRGAEIWRDSVMFLPRIKQDVVMQVLQTKETKKHIKELRVSTKDGVSHIYASSSIVEQIRDLPRWRELAQALNILKFHVHPNNHVRVKDQTIKDASWILLGFGSIAQKVAKRHPFKDNISALRKFDEMPGAFVVSDGATRREHKRKFGSKFAMGVFPSDTLKMRFVRKCVDELSEENLIKHAINYRPTGFGAPRKNELSVSKLESAFETFDVVWIVANHRQRRSVGNIPSNSPTSLASRHVNSLSRTLVSCLDVPWGADYLLRTRGAHKFGLVGVAKYREDLSVEEHVRRVVYSMLCEEANVHSADHIVVFYPSPFESELRRLQVCVGGVDYKVDLLPSDSGFEANELVGFAIGVKLSRRSISDFRIFCKSLVSGYGWSVVQDFGDYLLLENGEEFMRLCIFEQHDVDMDLPNVRDSITRWMENLVVTNERIVSRFGSFKGENRWVAIHYSDIEVFMEANYGSRLFDGGW